MRNRALWLLGITLAITAPADRTRHFGQFDHVRLYGRDLCDRIRDAGFALTERVAAMPEVLTYGLHAGETVFLAQRVSA